MTFKQNWANCVKIVFGYLQARELPFSNKQIRMVEEKTASPATLAKIRQQMCLKHMLCHNELKAFGEPLVYHFILSSMDEDLYHTQWV